MARRRGLGRRLAHEHVDDDAQVVERGRGGVEHHDHRQERDPAAGLDRGEDHQGLGEEAGGRRDAGQRQQEQRHQDAEQRLAPAEPGERLEADVTPARFWSAAITANAPRFMNEYAAP